MFNDRYGLTEAVLSGKKTMTRRVFKAEPQGCLFPVKNGYVDGHGTKFIPKYQVGEIVAIAQRYEEIFKEAQNDWWNDIYENYRRGLTTSEAAGYKNKMFTRADFLPHQIEITDVRIERLQEISREDCIKEGIEPMRTQYKSLIYSFKDFLKDVWLLKASPKEAYQLLISRISGKKVWDENPFVFVYEFKLVK